jgi:hypothetical protein
MKVRKHDYPTISLMKSFMDAESLSMIPHLIEKVPDLKSFIDSCIYKKRGALEGHTIAQ